MVKDDKITEMKVRQIVNQKDIEFIKMKLEKIDSKTSENKSIIIKVEGEVTKIKMILIFIFTITLINTNPGLIGTLLKIIGG